MFNGYNILTIIWLFLYLPLSPNGYSESSRLIRFGHNRAGATLSLCSRRQSRATLHVGVGGGEDPGRFQALASANLSINSEDQSKYIQAIVAGAALRLPCGYQAADTSASVPDEREPQSSVSTALMLSRSVSNAHTWY